LNWENYTTRVLQTAIYPHQGEFLGLNYVVLGLVGEAGELKEASCEGNNKQVKAELGDVSWYTAQIIRELNLSINKILEKKVSIKVNSLLLLKSVDQIVINATKIADITKKILRDDEEEIKQDKIDRVEEHLIYVIHGLYYACRILNISWEDVAKNNIDKLYSRQERNQLTGSGDER